MKTVLKYRFTRRPIAFAALTSLLTFASPLAADERRDGDHVSDSRYHAGAKVTVKSGLPMPYKLLSENGDLIVTVNGALLRIAPDGVVTKIADLPPGPPGSVSAFGADYVVVDNPSGRLLRVERSGRVSVIATGLGLPNIAVQEGDHFIVVDIATPVDTQPGQARLLKVTLDGRVTTIAHRGLGGPAGLYIDAEGYWLPDFILGRLVKVGRDGSVRVIAKDLGQPLDLDFDGEAFIVTDFAHGFSSSGVNKGRLLRITKKGDVSVLRDADQGRAGNPTGLMFRGPDIYYTDVVTGEIIKLVGPRLQTHPSRRSS